MTLLTIPSPTSGVLWLGSFPLRGYALSIITGIVVAVWLAQRRLNRFGGRGDEVTEITFWAVPFGIVGARLYHVVTTPQPYFGVGGHPLDALKIWHGGLGIWGGVMLGALGAWIGCRRTGTRFLDFADALAPALLVAQACGRLGNWFNNEIYGGPTDLPWKLKIYEWDAAAGHAVRDGSGAPIVKGYFHPTFLYEALWCLAVAALIAWATNHVRLHRGQGFALYVMGYTAGRFVIEQMRSDDANTIAGMRVNTWVSMILFALGLAWFLWLRRRSPARELVGGDADETTALSEDPEAAADPHESKDDGSTH